MMELTQNQHGHLMVKNWLLHLIVVVAHKFTKLQFRAENLSDYKAKRLSFEGIYNARARYSPDGKFITLVHSTGGSYHIAILDLYNSNSYINVLTKGPLDESPSFAPNGSMIIYATTGRRGGQLAAISVDGRIKQRLGVDYQGDVREPAWGPF